MDNISVGGESLKLKPNESFIAIEGLYINNIRSQIDNLDERNLLNDIRSKVFAFPFTDIPFATFSTKSGLFDVEWIKKIDYDHIFNNIRSQCFSCDSGLILLLHTEIISIIARRFDFEELVDSESDPISSKYWDVVTKDINTDSIGLVLAPGVNSGYDFEGGGVYRIDDNQMT